MKKHLLFSLLAMAAMPLVAQEEDDELWRIGRPEHVDTYITDDSGTHRAPRKVGSQATAPIKAFGEPNIPILLVEFDDRRFSAAGDNEFSILENYNYFFNGEDKALVNQHTGSYGSVRNYFMDMSQGQFAPKFHIIGPITLENGYAEYGKDSGSSKDTNIRAFYKEAATKAVNELNVDWSLFDNDGNGTVDLIYFIHAGWGQNVVNDFDKNAIWAKEGTASLTITTDDGQTVTCASYGVSAEARYKSSAQLREDATGAFSPTGYNPDNLRMDGIGVCVHEVSHALGLPDLYDKNYVAFGMDLWSVMDYGNYANNGYTPGGYTAYERNFMGWEELPVLTEPQIVTMKCFAEGGHGYKIVNAANADEYYTLDVRQPIGWDTAVGKKGHGLQVTHVDYSKTRWEGNNVNVEASHQRMTIVAANNMYSGSATAESLDEYNLSLAGNLYPGNTYNYNLTDDSTPAAMVYNGSYMHQPIRNITENEDGSVTFCFRTNGQLATPAVKEATDITEYAFTANWEAVENATGYIVELTTEEGPLQTVTLKASDLTDMQHVFSELASSMAMKYRVKAVADSPEDWLDSEWSDYAYTETMADFIASVPESNKFVTVYSTNGMPVTRCHADELGRLDVHPGIYVVKYANGAVRKIVLR